MRVLVGVFCVCLLIGCFPNISHAGEACYSKGQAEAEQGIRIHSELMIVGLNCAHMSDDDGNNLYVQYQKFTKKHEKLFATYEDILMTYQRENGDKDPEKSLHSLRTKFANKISNDVAQMRPDIFCRTYAKRIQKASKMDGDTVRKWASMTFSGHPVSHPQCDTDK